jgi:pimeloyl-ACP methyl ester carboxylesterase
MAHFILVHGMFHGGWCWDRLAQRLLDAGHRVDAPDLAGCGSDTTSPSDVTLQLWADSVVALAALASEPAIVVGHSRGGIVISQAAEAAPDKVAVLIYLTALMLPDGASAMSLPQIMQEEGFGSPPIGIVPRPTADGTAFAPPANAGELFYGTSSADDRAWAEPQLGLEPTAPLMTPISVSDERWGQAPKIYIETLQDRTLPLASQRAMIARVTPDEVITIDTDHMPMVSDIDELAAILIDIARRYTA